MAEERDERLVQRNAFGELMAMATENVVALAKIGADTGDLMVRNLRLAGRRDIARLGRQLARTEDKLERVLQEVESLRDELKRERSGKSSSSTTRARTSNGRSSSSSRSRSRSSSNGSSGSSKRSGGSRSKKSS